MKQFSPLSDISMCVYVLLKSNIEVLVKALHPHILTSFSADVTLCSNTTRENETENWHQLKCANTFTKKLLYNFFFYMNFCIDLFTLSNIMSLSHSPVYSGCGMYSATWIHCWLFSFLLMLCAPSTTVISSRGLTSKGTSNVKTSSYTYQ